MDHLVTGRLSTGRAAFSRRRKYPIGMDRGPKPSGRWEAGHTFMKPITIQIQLEPASTLPNLNEINRLMEAMIEELEVFGYVRSQLCVGLM